MRVARKARARRRGAMALEFALIVPVLLSVVFGVIDFGRTIMAIDLMNNVARAGARTGALSGRTNADITTVVDNALSAASLPARSSSATVLTIAVNGDTSANVSTAATDDQIAVTISAPIGSISWLPTQWILSRTAVVRGAVTMRRE
jgi:Flp pilus assembly protein TadG